MAAAGAEAPPDLASLEEASKALFGANAAARVRATSLLAGYFSSVQYIARDQWIINNYEKTQQSCFNCLILASKSLLKLVTTHWDCTDIRRSSALRNWIIDAVTRSRSMARGPLPRVAESGLVQAVARLVKRCWPNVAAIRTVSLCSELFRAKSATAYAQARILEILSETVAEFRKPYPGEGLSDHRSAKASFKHTPLLDAFRFGLGAARSASDENVRVRALELAMRCIGFNFYGGCGGVDETQAEATLHVPPCWNGIFDGGGAACADVYRVVWATKSVDTAISGLELLQMLSALPSSSFSSPAQYIAHVCALADGILDTVARDRLPALRTSPRVFLQWSRLLARVVTRATDIGDRLPKLLSLAHRWTLHSLGSWPSTMHASLYLLRAWGSLALHDSEARVRGLSGRGTGGGGGAMATDDGKDAKDTAGAGGSATEQILKLRSVLVSCIPELCARSIGRVCALARGVQGSGGAGGFEKGGGINMLDDGDFALFLETIPLLVRHRYPPTMMALLRSFRTKCQRWSAGRVGGGGAAGASGGAMTGADPEGAEIAAMVFVLAAIMGNPRVLPLSGSYPSESLAADAHTALTLIELMGQLKKRIEAGLQREAGEAQQSGVVLLSMDMGILSFIDAFTLHCCSTSIISVRSHRDLLTTAGLTRLVPMFDKQGYGDLEFLVSMGREQRRAMQGALNLSDTELRRLALQVDLETRKAKRSGTRLQRSGSEPAMFAYLSKLSSKSVRQEDVLCRFFCKIIESLGYWSGRSPRAVSQCLGALTSLTGDPATRRVLAKSSMTKALLSKADSGFDFLARLKSGKARTTFYAALGQLLFCRNNEGLLRTFMAPFDSKLNWLGQQSEFKSARVVSGVAGLCRDLQGLLDVVDERRYYQKLFDWFFPDHLLTILRALETWWSTPEVTTPVLKLFGALVHNRGGRISFKATSADGIRLFKHAAKVVKTYCARLQDVEAATSSLYDRKLKGLGLCMDLLSRALSGNYVCFEVFDVYSDQCVHASVEAVVRACLQIGHERFAPHPKLMRKFCDFLAVLFCDHFSIAVQLPTEVFKKLVVALTDGLCSADRVAVSSCAGAFDHIFEFQLGMHRARGKRGDADTERLRQHLQNTRLRAAQQRLISVIFNLVLFQQGESNAWCLSRPAATLIACESRAFIAFREGFVRSQRQETRAGVAAAFATLVLPKPNSPVSFADKNAFTKSFCKLRENIMSCPGVGPSTFG